MTIVSGSVPTDEGLPAVPADPALTGAFRELMSCFPTGVAVITAFDRDGAAHGMTCTSLASVTLCPPTLLVCLRCDSGTLAAARARGSFGVNLLHAEAREAAEIFSSPVPDRFGRVSWRPSENDGVPWLDEDAFALAECRVASVFRAGDHEVVFGTVVNAVQRPGPSPLLYGMRRFSAW
ncbi:flavin reductase family protein [Microbispora siamensis]